MSEEIAPFADTPDELLDAINELIGHVEDGPMGVEIQKLDQAVNDELMRRAGA